MCTAHSCRSRSGAFGVGYYTGSSLVVISRTPRFSWTVNQPPQSKPGPLRRRSSRSPFGPGPQPLPTLPSTAQQPLPRNRTGPEHGRCAQTGCLPVPGRTAAATEKSRRTAEARQALHCQRCTQSRPARSGGGNRCRYIAGHRLRNGGRHPDRRAGPLAFGMSGGQGEVHDGETLWFLNQASDQGPFVPCQARNQYQRD